MSDSANGSGDAIPEAGIRRQPVNKEEGDLFTAGAVNGVQFDPGSDFDRG
jgi:hypothetical protein